MPTQVKIDLVASLKERFTEASNVFVTDYTGLDVAQITKLRKDLRDNGIKYIVAKNTLMRIAAQETGYGDLAQYLNGPVAVAFSKADPNVPAKILYDARNEFKEIEKPEIKAFFIDKRMYGGADAERIAQLPSRKILLSMLIAAVEGPIAGMIGTLDGIIRELVGTVDALAKKKNEE